MRSAIVSIVCLSVAIMGPPLLAAELPAPAALGQLEGILDSCSKADPQSAPDYKKLREQLVQGVSEKDLAEVRGADGYKAAYKEINDRLEKTSKDDAMQECKVFLGTAATPTKDKKK